MKAASTCSRGGRPIAIDLFAGVGGLSLGLEQAGFDILLAVDRDPNHVSTFSRNFPSTTVICADITTLESTRIREIVGDHDIDLISGGPPCQGFSYIGKRNSSDPRNNLVKHFARIVSELRPKAFLLENVPGFQENGTGSPLADVIGQLAEARYRIQQPVWRLDASNFGVPQRRERLFLIGIRCEFQVGLTRPRKSCRHRPANPSVWDAISDLSFLGRRGHDASGDVRAYPRRHSSQLHPYAALARCRTTDPCDLAYVRHWEKDKCTGSSLVKHRKDVTLLYAATAPGLMVPSHHLPRLHPKRLSPTLRAGTDGEHGSFNAPRPIHPKEARCITVREAARLHGYPDWFQFHPTKWHAHRQIGNSVCSPVARAIGFAIRAALGLRAKKPRMILNLTSESPTLKRRGKPVRRIGQLEEWPKVLEFLFHKASQRPNGKLRRPSFSVGDVAEAYRATAARMPRTPPGRLLGDIARSRNRSVLLSYIHDKGFSILPVGRPGVYGKFVPVGTEGSLGSKYVLAIRRSELDTAVHLPSLRRLPSSVNSVVAALQHTYVKKELLNGRSIEAPRARVCQIHNRRTALFTIRARSRSERAAAIYTHHRNLPELDSIRRLLAGSRARKCIIGSTVTRNHFAFILIERVKNSARVKRQLVVKMVSARSKERS